MLAAGSHRHRSDAMELRRIIPSDITASAIAHLSLLTLMLLFSDVHPFGAVTAEQIPVEIVTPQDLAEKQAPAEQPPPRTSPNRSSANAAARFLRARQACGCECTPAVGTACALPRSRRSRLPSPRRARPSRQPRSPPQPQPAAPAYKPPEPDLSIKYKVLLGLPPDLAPLPPAPPQAATRATTISMRRRPRPPISRAAGRGIPAAPQDLLETAGLAVGRRRRQGQAARVDDTGRQARRRTDPDRGQRLHEGAVADAGRDQRAAGLPALRHAAGGPLRRMEGARPQFHAAGFFSAS